MHIGFIGLGDQGFPMAMRVRAVDLPLTVWARRPEVTEPLVRAGARRAVDLVALARECDVIGICVTAGSDVVDVVDKLHDGLRPGSLVAIHSTVGPATCETIAKRLATIGVATIDAPVSGGRPRAELGTLSVMVGGDLEHFEMARPMLESFGTATHIGPLGSGQVMKLLNNEMLLAHLELACQAIDVAIELGIDASTAEQQLLAGSGASNAMHSRIRFRDLDMDHVAKMLAKDHELYRRFAVRHDTGASIDGLASDLLQRLRTRSTL